MTTPSETPIRDQLSQRLNELSPQLKRAAHYVLDNPDEIATQSLRHVARAADLAPPTFSRLARAAGFASYQELRNKCRDAYRARSTRFADRALELIEGASGVDAANDDLLVRHAAASVVGIEALLADIDVARLDAAAARLASSRRVALIGALSAAAFVEYAGYVSGMALPNWSVFGRNGSSLPSQILDLGSEDAALCISMSPYAGRTVRATQLARAQGAFVLTLTDAATSPLVECADASFFVSTESPQFFPSHVAMLVLLETLIGHVVRRRGLEAQQRIATVERQSSVLGEYWPSNPVA
ncbi:MAG: MurR/RpiR family transcriptional regulator [Pseudomonadota bacterium]